MLREDGETLLTKALKAEPPQWDLVEWMLMQGDHVPEVREQLPEIVEQVRLEFASIWDREECRTHLQPKELANLEANLDSHGRLRQPWRRNRCWTMPAGTQLLAPAPEILRRSLREKERWSDLLVRDGFHYQVFAAPLVPDARRRWLIDLVGLGERTFGMPLLHRAVAAGRSDEFLRELLDAMVAVDSPDPRGRTALAAAATAGRWRAVRLLLQEGCRADGTSGDLAIAAALQALDAGYPCSAGEAEEGVDMTELIELLRERRQRAPCSTLVEYFQKQVRQDLVHGAEPRRWELSDRALVPKGGGKRVWAKAIVVEPRAPTHSVFFAQLSEDDYAMVTMTETLTVTGQLLAREDKLGALDAVAVAIPPEQVRLEAKGATVTGAPDDPLAKYVSVVGCALSQAALNVTSSTACCNFCIGRVEILVRLDAPVTSEEEGAPREENPLVRLGETKENSALLKGDFEELELTVPPRKLEMSAEYSSRPLCRKKVFPETFTPWHVTVSVAVYVYVQYMGDDDPEKAEMVFVCAHRRDVPEDAYPYVGEVRWETGKRRIGKPFKPIVLGSENCLGKLSSMEFAPDLKSGREWDSVEWEDTGDCQFQRIAINPVRVGKIFTAVTNSPPGSEAPTPTAESSQDTTSRSTGAPAIGPPQSPSAALPPVPFAPAPASAAPTPRAIPPAPPALLSVPPVPTAAAATAADSGARESPIALAGPAVPAAPPIPTAAVGSTSS